MPVCRTAMWRRHCISILLPIRALRLWRAWPKCVWSPNWEYPKQSFRRFVGHRCGCSATWAFAERIPKYSIRRIEPTLRSSARLSVPPACGPPTRQPSPPVPIATTAVFIFRQRICPVCCIGPLRLNKQPPSSGEFFRTTIISTFTTRFLPGQRWLTKAQRITPGWSAIYLAPASRFFLTAERPSIQIHNADSGESHSFSPMGKTWSPS